MPSVYGNLMVRFVILKMVIRDRAFDYTPILLSHEIMYKIVVDKIGKGAYQKTPKWLVEGFLEYVSDSTFLSNLLSNQAFLEYNKYELVVSYLIKVKGIKDLELFKNPLEYDLACKEASKWSEKTSFFFPIKTETLTKKRMTK